MHKYNVNFYTSLKNVKEQTIINLMDFFNDIKTGKYRHEVEPLRQLTGDAYKVQKNLLPCITPSGVFTQRKAAGIKEHSGIICIDVDNIENAQDKLSSYKIYSWILAMFISPSNKGVKIFVRIDPQKHLESFLSLETLFKNKLQVDIDKACKDVSRLCFVSYDPDIYVNNDAIIYEVKNFVEPENFAGAKSFKIKKSKQDEVELLIKKIESTGTNIADDYFEYRDIGFALASEFKFIGEDYFHRISRFSNKYIYEQCKKDYQTYCTSAKSGININTLFAIAKKHNVLVHENNSSIKKKEKTASANTRTNAAPQGVNVIIQLEKFLNSHYDLRFNNVTNRIEERKKNEVLWKDLNENNIYRFLLHNNINISMAKLTALLRSDFVEVYNPFTDYFENLKSYDRAQEPDYISNLCSYIYALNEDRFKNHLFKHLVRCIACAVNDNYFNKQSFILVHNAQNSGKSTLCRWFTPPQLEKYYGENVNLTNKDGEIALSEKFIINLDELAALSKYEINQLKSVMSRDKISVRRPFERSTSDSPRRCSFFGSTNRSEFLFDETGSVRWLCFEIEKIDWNYKIDIDVNDIWRQAYSLYKNGFKHDLTPAEIHENELANNQFFISSPEQDLLLKFYTPGTKEKCDRFMTTTDILQRLQEGCNNAIKINSITLGRILTKCNFEKGTFRVNSEPTKGYYMNFLTQEDKKN